MQKLILKKIVSNSTKVGLLLVFLGLWGCASEPQKPQTASSRLVEMSDVKPLATELSYEDQFKLSLDVVSLEINSEEYDKAERLLTKLRKYNPESIEVYRQFTRLYEKQQRLDRALLAAEGTLSRQGGSRNDEQVYARLALMNGQFAKADHIYQQWLDNADNDTLRVIALNNLGFSALLQKRFEKASAYFEQALALDPLNEKARNNLHLIQTQQ